ncbi:starch-binding protein [Zobellella sp. DQSA1]|uniref:starch-binding protein n=1 Tax=Zobellella sp. DQSA1 TaxID=3342386 RepID=UPI0035C0A807
MKVNKGLSAGLVLFGSMVGAAPSVAAEVPRTAFVHLFEWSWQDIAQECEEFLGPKGFAAVQVSPPNKTIDNPAWWSRYQPVSYAFESRSGNRAQFADMVQRCKAAGVDIYVDAVINHMAAWDRDFPEVPYGPNDFNNCTDDIDYSNRWSVQNCDLVGLNDLKTSSEYVRNKIADYMNDAISMGVAGFRIDAAKHMPHEDVAAIIGKLNGNPYIFQEVIGAANEPVETSEYTYIGDVTEFNFARTLGPRFKHGGIKDLQGIGSWNGWLSSDKAVTFANNHDEERHNPNQVLSFQDFGDLYFLGNVFTFAYPYGYPKVMSGYFFNHFDDAPPATGVHSGNACGFDGGDWVCEHRWRGIANMVAFRNHTAAEWRVTDWWDDGYNQIAFGRGGLGFVVINRDDNKGINQGFATGMPGGEYCDIIAGNFDEASGTCDGPTVLVDGSGNAHFTVPSHQAAAIHIGAKVGDVVTPPPGDHTQVCYDNAANFANPYVHFWDVEAAAPVANATWPGQAMNQDGDVYCHDFGVALSSLNVIFSDQGSNQSADLTATSPGLCHQNGAWTALADCKGEPESGGDETWYLRGTANGWGLTELDYDAQSGLYTTTVSFNGEESPARFKVDDGSWTESYPAADYQVGDHATYLVRFNSDTKDITVTQQ